MKSILVGTSGWAYDDWEGPFYPGGVHGDARVAHYAQVFPAVEVKFRHDAAPTPELVAERVGVLTGAGLRHAVFKAPHPITHETVPNEQHEQTRALSEAFFRSLVPAAEAGVLEGILFQFDHRTGPVLVDQWMADIEALAPPAPLFVEVRHAHFNEDRHYAVLHERLAEMGGALVATDSPAATITRPLPADTAYFRFHGRNRDTWFVDHPSGDVAAARYDHRYSKEELEELAVRVEEAEADEVFVFFNNHPRGHAPVNAAAFRELLGLPLPAQHATLDDFA